MAKIYPTDWKTQVRIFELYGCQYKRKKGSHHVLTYPGAKRVPYLKLETVRLSQFWNSEILKRETSMQHQTP